MTDTIIVNLRKERCDVKIGRGRGGKIPNPPHEGCFGNPYPLSKYTLEESLRLYRIYFYNRIKIDKTFRKAILELRGKRLGCFCKPAPCHGDIIKEFLDSYQGEYDDDE